jgi:hypothetical protein
VVEVAHEALIRAWPTFGRWIDAARADLRLQLQLEDTAKEWAASAEKSEFLWSGLRLTNTTAWQKRARPQLSQRERRFLEASQAARRRARNLRVATIGAVVGLIIAALAIFAIGQAQLAQQQQQLAQQRQQDAATAQALAVARAQALATANVARFQTEQQRDLAQQHEIRARAGELAAQSEAESVPSSSRLLLAVEALRVTTEANEPRIASAEQALRDALANAGELGLSGHTGAVTAVAFSPDGKRLATASVNGAAQLWDLTTADVTTSPIVLRNYTYTYQPASYSPKRYTGVMSAMPIWSHKVPISQSKARFTRQ